MGYKLVDLKCQKCENEWEDLVSQDEGSLCPKCTEPGTVTTNMVINMGAYSMLTPEMRRESLKKRSDKHTQKHIDATPEKWGDAGIERRSKKIQVGYR
jgi:hypothetical protein